MYTLRLLAYFLLALPITVLSQSSCSGSVATTNGGRKIGIAIDSSGSMVDTDPHNLRIVAGKAIASSLISAAEAGPNGNPDRVTVIDFDDTVRIVYPLGDPASVSFAGIDSSGGTYIALGVKAAIDQITADTGSATAHVSGVVVLTDGQDNYVAELVVQLNRAQGLGIRVSFGFLSPFDTTSSQDPSILSAILSTGGIYTTIGDSTAQANFVNLVLSHGLTDSDQSGGHSLLLPGLLTAGNVSATSGTEAFTYDAISGENLNFTVSAISQQSFFITLYNKDTNRDIGSASTDVTGAGSILFTASGATSLELDIGTQNTTSGLFTVSLSSSLNRTITICGAGNVTTVPSSNNTYGNGTYGNGTYGNGTYGNGTSSNSTYVRPNTTTFSLPSSPTPTSAPQFTGGAAALQTLVVTILFPTLMALGFVLL